MLTMLSCLRTAGAAPLVQFIDAHGLEEAGVDGGGIFKEFIETVCVCMYARVCICCCGCSVQQRSRSLGWGCSVDTWLALHPAITAMLHSRLLASS